MRLANDKKIADFLSVACTPKLLRPIRVWIRPKIQECAVTKLSQVLFSIRYPLRSDDLRTKLFKIIVDVVRLVTTILDPQTNLVSSARSSKYQGCNLGMNGRTAIAGDDLELLGKMLVGQLDCLVHMLRLARSGRRIRAPRPISLQFPAPEPYDGSFRDVSAENCQSTSHPLAVVSIHQRHPSLPWPLSGLSTAIPSKRPGHSNARAF